MKLHCDHCGAELTPDTAHVFKSITRKLVAIYCDGCCIRCDFIRQRQLAAQKSGAR